MELFDKSYSDLIRRLPIIVLEDSSLHPDFGLLVWLMVAESKVSYDHMCNIVGHLYLFHHIMCIQYFITYIIRDTIRAANC